MALYLKTSMAAPLSSSAMALALNAQAATAPATDKTNTVTEVVVTALWPQTFISRWLRSSPVLICQRTPLSSFWSLPGRRDG